MAKLKVGDTVLWRGGFGSEPSQRAKVESIEICESGKKYGTPVDEVDWNTVMNGDVTVDLDNGHWAYGHQISQIK